MASFQCQRCGWCCRNANINISYSDVVRWKNQKRFDVLAQIAFMDFGDGDKRSGFYFIKSLEIDKEKGIKKPCPFLRGIDCTIYDTRPRSCRDFPLVRKNYGKCPEMKRLVANVH